jgi:hypothetical protein
VRGADVLQLPRAAPIRVHDLHRPRPRRRPHCPDMRRHHPTLRPALVPKPNTAVKRQPRSTTR